MRRNTLSMFLFITLIIYSSIFAVNVRIKDFAKFRGARDNQLFGVGIVVGLNGTGDSGTLNSTLLSNMLKNFGVTVNPNDLKTRNVALVMVVADIPPFYKPGMRLDVEVASINDAKSLRNGILLQTPLYGADGNVYAVAQGPVSVGGEDAKGSVNLQKRFPVVGYIPEGALVEREIPFSIVDGNSVTILLNKPDFTTAARTALAINTKFGTNIAKALDSASVKVNIPNVFSDDVISFLALLEEIEVPMDVAAQVVINERTGTVVFGGDIGIADFVLSYGNFVITITNGQIGDKKATIGNLITALKSLGATPQDIIAIVQELYKAGVIFAQLKIM
ncbi:flagellar basal body P-ring protein FlgI [Fervidobacterium sp. 2310opik-2]|uniref:flagellar basal body P-ring protein FlgI n=1 Tax=Fervidobacterium sp. 2310opik-2 TaxID=1755815 RepID=UPI0013DE7A0C|nr:flagellar basal body P-ring protein FlgI [Fervidobacterium sp. 2310opik-2]KAF2961623.1 flagellar biosynthesis protein FlgI [Fervidobacterium sp. 2310opik-2]